MSKQPHIDAQSHDRDRREGLLTDDSLILAKIHTLMGQIVERLDRLGPGTPIARKLELDTESAPARSAFFLTAEHNSDMLARDGTPRLPSPKLVRRIIRRRQMRARFFADDLFADPAWDMLLDLAAARAEKSRVSVTSLCIASCVPPTTALRWIGLMTELGLLQRIEDQADRRRAFIALTDRATEAMARYFAEVLGDDSMAV